MTIEYLFIWCILSFGWLPGVSILCADVSDHPVCSIFTGGVSRKNNRDKIYIYRVSQEEWVKLRESGPYVKLYRYNPKHLYPKLNGYGDNGQRSLKLWQLLHTYWLQNTYWNWQEYVVSVMLISVLNIKVTCEWHKAIKLNDKNTRHTVVFVLRFPSTLRSPQLMSYRVTSELTCTDCTLQTNKLFMATLRYKHKLARYVYLPLMRSGRVWCHGGYSTWKPHKPPLFDGHYLRNRSTLDIGVLGYIGIV